MIVTEIKPVTRQKFQIELDGQPAFVLYKGELSRYHIQKDEELPEEIYEELVGQVLTKRAKLRAMHLLEKMDRTRAELKKKLEQSGYPTKAVEEALKAERGGADYLGIGTVFYTGSKKDINEPLGLENLKIIADSIKIPSVAIGGIHLNNVKEVMKTGVCGVAVISEILGKEDIEEASKTLLSFIK